MTRFAHISDIHVSAQPLGWRMRDYMTKRVVTWMNMRVNRGRKFRRSEDVLRALEIDRRQRGLDYVVFSGDATNFGLANETRRAATLLGVERGPGLAVPGNHDYMTHSAARSGDFERAFAPWQKGERVDQHIYPFAQKLGGAWLIAVNSARSNRWFWNATGAVGEAQAERLQKLLEMLPPGPRILVTHYPIGVKDGKPELKARGLVDLARVVEIARRGGVGCWLHGHRHGFYQLPNPLDAGFPAVCIGSGTQEGHWSYGDYTIDGSRLTGIRRIYHAETNCFNDGEAIRIELDRSTTAVG